jgi:dipeptidyl-peptidase 4
MSVRAGCRALALATSVVALLAVVPRGAMAQAAPAPAPRPVLTADDYARAERFLAANTSSLVLHGPVRPNWLVGGTRFWYRTLTAEGSEFVLVDVDKGAKTPAFDHAKLAEALSKASGGRYDARHLPFTSFAYSADGRGLSLAADGRSFTCEVSGAWCTAGKPVEASGPRPESVSPDGRLAAFIRNDNLWVREVATGVERRLTDDGARDFGYATDNAGWTRSDRPVLLWSPDSKKIATFQQDQRGVGEMYLVETKVGRPALQAWKYPLPGDAVVATIQRVVVHLDGPRVVRLKMAPDQHRGTITDDIKGRDNEWDDVEWSADSRQLAFVSTSRDHKAEQFRVADPDTGVVRDVFEEKTSTYFESGMGTANWRFLPATGEVLWLSERDDWAHLYLYDLQTGRLKNAVTGGAWNVTEALRVDEKARQVYFLGVGREPGRDPYFRHLYRASLDGRTVTLLTPADADHDVSVSPAGTAFVDNASRPDQPPTSVLRAADGREILALEKADVSRLLEAGWKPPVPITVKARDGETDLYGLMFRPTNFDPAKKYPIVDNVYPGPQTGSVGSRSFSASRGDAQALAELGFVVVQIDGMCTPWRSKSFHASCYGNIEDNTLPDQVAGLEQLARRFPWIDLDRAGVYGGSGGGYAAAAAMFRYPDFFKVGVSVSGNHDNRGYEDDWLEKWQGLQTKTADGTTSYDRQANQDLAKNLKGKLLLAHGTMDGNVPPNNTLLVVDALIRANKDFDLILFPNRGHGLNEPYMIRRRWDYFVRYLRGAEPPAEYEIGLSQPAAK